MNFELKPLEILDIRNSISTRIMWIEDHILPAMKAIDNTDFVNLYLKEIDTLTDIHNKLTLFK